MALEVVTLCADYGVVYVIMSSLLLCWMTLWIAINPHPLSLLVHSAALEADSRVTFVSQSSCHICCLVSLNQQEQHSMRRSKNTSTNTSKALNSLENLWTNKTKKNPGVFSQRVTCCTYFSAYF